MTSFQVDVRVVPRVGILDPQGKAVGEALTSLGFEGVREVHVGRVIRLVLAAVDEAAARDAATAMCRQLLANPVTEDYELEIREMAGAAR